MNLIVLFFILNVCFGLLPKKDFKPNVFIATDISNEPDDAESLVRLLLYSNDLSIKGIVATTSYWLNDTTHEEDIYPIIDAYEAVHPSLLKHSPDYPTADYLRSIVCSSYPVYGLEAFKKKQVSDGAALLINAVQALPRNETLYVLVWGGAQIIAEALREVSKGSKYSVNEFTEKLHIYSISDQDDAGAWIRFNFPEIPYIASIHGFNQYGISTWVGIAGEDYNSFDYGGPDSRLISKAWLKENIQSVGPLGNVYPEYAFNMEGDTPTTLSVIPNGLNFPSHPEYGGWGGRYTLSDLSGAIRHFADVADYVVGQNNVTFVSNKATIWRWRSAYQNDFAARMQWTVQDFETSIHAPIAVANGSDSVKPFELEIECDSKVILDASASYDLNGRDISFNWFHYYDISLTQGNRIEVPEIEIRKLNENGSLVEFTIPGEKQSCFDFYGRPWPCKVYHIILEVTNNAEFPVTSYKRFVIKTKNVEANKNSNSHDEL